MAHRGPYSSRIRPLTALPAILVAPCALLGMQTWAIAANAATYYVDASVAQSGSGTSPDQALKTIGECAQTAVAGDVCLIAAGTYRENVYVNSSGGPGAPVVFRAETGQRVVISGLETIEPNANGAGAWEAVTINGLPIHKIQLSPEWDLGIGENQVFVDGEPMTEARWPNVVDPVDLNRNDYAISTDGTLGAVVSGDLRRATYSHPEIQGDWAGGYVTFGPGKEWWGKFGSVTSSPAGMVSYEFELDAGSVEHGTPAADDPFFLWGRLEALDSEKEWYFDGTGEYGSAHTLYLWFPGGDPSGRVVEMKRRGTGIYVDAHDVRVEGIHFFAVGIGTAQDSASVTIDKIVAEYTGHDLLGWGQVAVSLNGSQHQLTNSTIRYGNGAVSLSGANHLVENNVMHDLGYVISNGDGIHCSDTTGSTITRNTIFETSWKGISVSGLKQGVVSFNHVYRTAKQGTDIAAINSWNGGDGQGTSIEYNVVHDIVGYYKPDTAHYGGQGIRLDSGGAPNGNSNFVIHHNIVFNTTANAFAVWGLEPHMPNYGNANNQIYNNTSIGPFSLLINPYELPTTTVKNNLVDGRCSFCDDDPLPVGLIAENNLFFDDPLPNNVSGNPLFEGPFHHDYSLRAGSPAIDAGQVVPTINEGHVGGAPDIGALEAGKKPFVAGALIWDEHLADLQASCEIGVSETVCRVTGIPMGRAVPEEFGIRVGGQPSDDCTNGLDVPTHESFAICTFSAPLGEGMQPLAVSLDQSAYVDSPQQASVTAEVPFCSQEALTTPITAQDLGGRDLTRRPLLLEVDTARLIAEGTLKSDCSDLRVRNFDLSEDFAIWVDDGTCGTTRTLVWALDPLGGAIDAAHQRYSALHLLHGNTAWESRSDRARLFPLFSLGTAMWLKADALHLQDGDPVADWVDVSDGGGRPAVQTDVGQQPTFRTAGGYPVVDFDGTDDRMLVPGMVAQGEASVFVVYRNPVSGDQTWPRIVSAGVAGQNDYETGLAIFPDLGTDNRALPMPDGAQVRTIPPESRSFGNFTVGAGFERGGFFQGGVAEILMFDSDVGWNAAQEFESYFGVKYRLLEGLPTTQVDYDQTRAVCAGGVGPPDAGTGGGGGSAGYGGDAGPGAGQAVPSGGDDGGCGCRVTRPAATNPLLLLGLLTLVCSRRRRRTQET